MVHLVSIERLRVYNWLQWADELATSDPECCLPIELGLTRASLLLELIGCHARGHILSDLLRCRKLRPFKQLSVLPKRLRLHVFHLQHRL